METLKRCTRCHLDKTPAEFTRHQGQKSGLNPRCRDCTSEVLRVRYQADSSYDRSQKLQARFGITIEEYEALLRAQRGFCAICGRPERRTNRGNVKRLAVDHDHATGTIRGLLCHDCNCALGFIEDDPSRLEMLMKYLAKP